VRIVAPLVPEYLIFWAWVWIASSYRLPKLLWTLLRRNLFRRELWLQPRSSATLNSVPRGYNLPDMSFLRFLMLLSLVVWIGGLIFFAFVVAPTAFKVLPTTHLAGNMVAHTLGWLHRIAIASGVIFLISSLLYSRFTDGTAHVFAARHILLCLMLALTLISQFGIMPRMDTLRASLGDVQSAPVDNPDRVQFDSLHVWSTRVEGAVLLLGLVVVYLVASSF
jgi:hypothetical protein